MRAFVQHSTAIWLFIETLAITCKRISHLDKFVGIFANLQNTNIYICICILKISKNTNELYLFIKSSCFQIFDKSWKLGKIFIDSRENILILWYNYAIYLTKNYIYSIIIFIFHGTTFIKCWNYFAHATTSSIV